MEDPLAVFKRSLIVVVGVCVSNPMCHNGLCSSDRRSFRSHLPSAGLLTFVKRMYMSDLYVGMPANVMISPCGQMVF